MPDLWYSSICENVQNPQHNRISRCKDSHKFILERDKLIKPYGNRDNGRLGQNLLSYLTGITHKGPTEVLVLRFRGFLLLTF